MTRIPLFALLCMIALALASGAPANMAPPTREFRMGLTLSAGEDGPQVASLAKDGVAAKNGLKVGDVLLAIDQRYHKAMSAGDLKSFAEDAHVFPVELVVLRGTRVSTYFVEP
ncbi:MAG: PDZ domain-containing protein [Alphaproteobacteria bacterium]